MFSQAATTLFASVTQTGGLYIWTGLFSLVLCLLAAWVTLLVTRRQIPTGITP